MSEYMFGHNMTQQGITPTEQAARENVTGTQSETNAVFGPGYDDVVALIEEGKEKSHKDGFAKEKVFFNGEYVLLQKFLATEIFRMRGRGELTKAGVDDILERYLDKLPQRSSTEDEVIVAEIVEEEPRELPPRMAALAIESYDDHRHHARDGKSAAAGDFDD